MLELSQAAVHVVAGDSRASIDDLDTWIRTQLRLATHIADGLAATKLPARRSQHLLRTLHEGLGKAVESRASMVSLIDQLTIIHRQSNQAEVDAGCPTVIDWPAGADKNEPAVA